MAEVATSPFRIERLADSHNRKAFSCGSEPIDHWFQTLAGQQSKREVVAVHLAIDNRNDAIVGFYTLCNFTVLAADLPLEMGRRMPRTPIPVHLLGHLGVSVDYQRRGIGEALVTLAVASAEEQTKVSASIGVLVHARSEKLVEWYRKIGFRSIPSDPLHLLYTMADFRKVSEAQRKLREAEEAARRPGSSA